MHIIRRVKLLVLTHPWHPITDSISAIYLVQLFTAANNQHPQVAHVNHLRSWVNTPNNVSHTTVAQQQLIN